MSGRLNDVHKKGQQDAARRREHGGIADDLVRLIGGRDAYDHTPDDKDGRDAYNKGVRKAKSEPSSCKPPALTRAPLFKVRIGR